MGRAGIHATKVDVEAMVETTVEELAFETQGRDITWKIAPLPRVSADPTLLRQVWVNLISNAVKFTSGREPAQIQIGTCANSNGEDVFFVRDNGTGFDMQYAHKLFRVFQRLHLPDQFDGAGIGLANVHRIVSRHGGRTWAEGKSDAGATFYFALPKHRGKVEELAPLRPSDHEPSDAAASSLEPGRIRFSTQSNQATKL